MQINGIELSGKVTNLRKEWEDEHNWWECHFELDGMFLCDTTVKCYTSLGKAEPIIEEGDEVIIRGHLCAHDSEIIGKYFNIMVCEIIKISGMWNGVKEEQ